MAQPEELPFISPCPPAIVMLWVWRVRAHDRLAVDARGATTAVRAGLGVARAKSESPSASTPARVARASRSWRRKTLANPSRSSILNTTRRPTTMGTAGVKCASFFARVFRSAARSK